MISKEELNDFRKELEGVVEDDKEKRKPLVKKQWYYNLSSVIERENHNHFVQGVNRTLELLHQNYNIPYEPIKSELKIN